MTRSKLISVAAILPLVGIACGEAALPPCDEPADDPAHFGWLQDAAVYDESGALIWPSHTDPLNESEGLGGAGGSSASAASCAFTSGHYASTGNASCQGDATLLVDPDGLLAQFDDGAVLKLRWSGLRLAESDRYTVTFRERRWRTNPYDSGTIDRYVDIVDEGARVQLGSWEEQSGAQRFPSSTLLVRAPRDRQRRAPQASLHLRPERRPHDRHLRPGWSDRDPGGLQQLAEEGRRPRFRSLWR